MLISFGSDTFYPSLPLVARLKELHVVQYAMLRMLHALLGFEKARVRAMYVHCNSQSGSCDKWLTTAVDMHCRNWVT